jgi:hypothetical protein
MGFKNIHALKFKLFFYITSFQNFVLAYFLNTPKMNENLMFQVQGKAVRFGHGPAAVCVTKSTICH